MHIVSGGPFILGKVNESESEYEMENEARSLADKLKSQKGENFEKINAETESLVDVRMGLAWFGMSNIRFWVWFWSVLGHVWDDCRS